MSHDYSRICNWLSDLPIIGPIIRLAKPGLLRGWEGLDYSRIASKPSPFPPLPLQNTNTFPGACVHENLLPVAKYCTIKHPVNWDMNEHYWNKKLTKHYWNKKIELGLKTELVTCEYWMCLECLGLDVIQNTWTLLFTKSHTCIKLSAEDAILYGPWNSTSLSPVSKLGCPPFFSKTAAALNFKSGYVMSYDSHYTRPFSSVLCTRLYYKYSLTIDITIFLVTSVW